MPFRDARPGSQSSVPAAVRAQSSSPFLRALRSLPDGQGTPGAFAWGGMEGAGGAGQYPGEGPGSRLWV